MCKSNITEQSNSFLETTREKPICDIVSQMIGKMCDYRFHRARKANDLINNGHKLTPHALSAHSSVVLRSNMLICEPEEADADGSFTCVVRKSADKSDYKVRVTPTYEVKCSCRHYEELLRPCDHAVAAIKAASNLVDGPQYKDVMDYRWLGAAWHLQTWQAQHAGVIKRVVLVGHGDKLHHEDIIPPRLHPRTGRKRARPYKPSESKPRTCPACGKSGHFSGSCPNPSSAHLSKAKRRSIMEAADALVIDLTKDIE